MLTGQHTPELQACLPGSTHLNYRHVRKGAKMLYVYVVLKPNTFRKVFKGGGGGGGINGCVYKET